MVNVVHLDVDQIMCQKGNHQSYNIPISQKSGFTTRMVKKIPSDFTVTNNTVICAEHFKEDDIIRYKPNTNPKVSI